MSNTDTDPRVQTAQAKPRRWPPRAEHVGSLLRPKALLERLGDAATADANVAMAEGRAVSDELR
jgi:hypothetical protein